MPDRDAAPAAAEGADDELYAEFLRGFMPEVAPTSIVGLTLRHAWDAALEVYGAARPAPPAAPRECITCEGECLVGDPTTVDGQTTAAHFGFDVTYARSDSPRLLEAEPAAPAAAEGAEPGESEAFSACWRSASERFPNNMDVAVAMWMGGKEFARAASPALAAAPREGGETFTEAELRTYAENLLASGSGPHVASGRSILAMMQLLTALHRQAAREAARGEGA